MQCCKKAGLAAQSRNRDSINSLGGAPGRGKVLRNFPTVSDSEIENIRKISLGIVAALCPTGKAICERDLCIFFRFYVTSSYK